MRSGRRPTSAKLWPCRRGPCAWHVTGRWPACATAWSGPAMTDDHLSASDVSDYWAPDVTADAAQRIEAHVFACAKCAQRLEAARAVIDGVRDAVRRGRFQAVVTEAVLNRLARDGARMRMFTLDAGAVVP